MQQISSNGFSEIYILNTDSQKFSLSGIIPLKAGEIITGMCYVKTTDGTPCLILSAIQPAGFIQCVEIIGGKVRWQLGVQQMGESFTPLNICTDGNIIFVAEVSSAKLHMLSLDGGEVIMSISLHPFGIDIPICIRLQGEHLYVGHMDEKREAYCINKFTKPKTASSIDM